MSIKTTAAITAVGSYVPETVLSNFDLEKMVETNNEWILSRTGISERRIQKGEGLGTSDMIVPAVLDICKKRGIKPEEIECMIVGTITPDYPFPSTANVVCDKIGAVNAWGFDLNAACSGFIYGLTVGASLIESGRYKKVIVVGADKMSSIMNYKDRSTCIIFGDGAGAALLEPNHEGLGVLDSVLKSDGSGRHALLVPGGGSLEPTTQKTLDAGKQFLFQDGATVFKRAVKGMAEVSLELMDRNHLTANDFAWLVPHQANLRIIDATATRVGMPPERVMINIEKLGNTTGGTIPLLLTDWESKLKKGDNLLISAFGGGFTWGAVWLKWAY